MNPPCGHPFFEDCPTCEPAGSISVSTAHNARQRPANYIATEVLYPEGAVIFLEGQLPRGVFVLHRGRVKLSITNAGGKRLISRIAFPGDILGLHSAMIGDPYDTTAETLRPSQLEFITRVDLLRFLNDNGDARLHVLLHLSQDYAKAYELIRPIALRHSASARLARLLLDSSTGEQSVGAEILVKLTHEDFAQLIGVSRETVTRSLADFRRRRILDSVGSPLHIRNRPALEKIAAS